MTARGDPSTSPVRIGVGIAISDPRLAQRLISLLSGAPHLEVSRDDKHDPDVILADRVHVLRGPSIIIDDGARIPDVWDADIRAVLPSNVDEELLRAAIKVVSAGFMISQADELHGFSDGASRFDRPFTAAGGEIALTVRETEVLGLLAHGASNKFIARELNISVHTAKFHVASVLVKLGARNRSDAVAIGIRRGLILL
jgi:DNA-binding CsgD family transcriptional regulator